MKAIRPDAPGGPEVMQLRELPTDVPGPGQVLVRVEATGVNFIDVYHRSGQYPAKPPIALGAEGAGIVQEIGPGVADFRIGDRVAWASVPGSYSTHVVATADKLVPIPPEVDTRTAAALMLQGMTAHYLSQSTYRLTKKDTCLVHAAAGGVGLLLTQMAKRAGARVIATVSTEAKGELAKGAGADDVILYTKEDFEPAVKRLTGGRGVTVVYDSVGKTTFDKSLDCLSPLGMMVLFGQSSGRVPPVDLQVLAAKGSLFVTRPTLVNYVSTREDLMARAGDVLGWVAKGELSVRIGATFALSDAAAAHRALEGRATTGKVLLLP